MSASWEHSYGACAPASAAVLRAVAALDLAVVSSPAVGVAADLTPAETDEAMAELVRTGWAVTVAGGEHHALTDRARSWVATNRVNLVDNARAGDMIRGFVEHHAEAVDLNRHGPTQVGAWLRRHRAEVLAAVRACDHSGLRELGTRLAGMVWQSAGLVNDPRWWQELADAGETVAIAGRNPAALADLLHNSAVTFAGQGDRIRAEAQWLRALAIVRRTVRAQANTGNHQRAVAILTGLRDLYRGWGRLSKTLDVELQLVDVRRAAGDAVATAEALASVAIAMRAAGRLSSALDYLAQADAAISPVTNTDSSPAQARVFHTRILVRWGRALWEQDQHATARRQWSRALAMLIDVDDHAADHVRALLATGAEDPLPTDDYSGLSNTSSSSSGGKG